MREPATSYIIHGQCVILGETFSPGSLADYHFKLCRESHQDIPSLSKSWTMIIADMFMVNKPPHGIPFPLPAVPLPISDRMTYQLCYVSVLQSIDASCCIG